MIVLHPPPSLHVRKDGWTAMIFAACMSDRLVVKALLEGGADPRQVDKVRVGSTMAG
jgi:ankyrin repeat protein